ncbi:MAG: DCC1-like thiol-disulfide oxidoreductase family protein [Planctomycetota bacterium]
MPGVALVVALAFPGAESLGRLVPALVVGLSLLLPTRPPAAGSSPRIAFVLLAAGAFLVLVLLLRAPAADTIAALGVLVVVDPVFVRARRDGTPARLFYDGECGFCHGWVRLAAQEDAAGVFRFAPLFGATFDERFPGERAKEVPEGIVLVLADDSVLTRSDAALRAAAMLGGWWRVLAWLGRVLPKPLRELGYGAVARVRRRLAPKPTGACPMLPPELAARFDP